MACAVAPPHPAPLPMRTPRRTRAASPYARSASVGAHPYACARARPRPLTLSLALNVPSCAVASSASSSSSSSVSECESACSSPVADPRVRRHVYSASAPSSCGSLPLSSKHAKQECCSSSLFPSKQAYPTPCPTSVSVSVSLSSSSTSEFPSSSASSFSNVSSSSSSSSAATSPSPSSRYPPASGYPYPYLYSDSDSTYPNPSAPASHLSLSLSLSISPLPSPAPSPNYSPTSACSDGTAYFSCPASAVEPEPGASSPRAGNWSFSPLSPSYGKPEGGSWAPWALPSPPSCALRLDPSPSSSAPWPTSPAPPSPSVNHTYTYTPPPAPAPAHPSPLLASTPPSFSHITPHLAIADLAFAESEDLMRREGVTHVVSVLGERAHIPSFIPPANRLHVPLDDAPFAELVGALGPVVRWVREALAGAGVFDAYCHADFDCEDTDMADGAREKAHTHTHIRILIHCAQGISRSPAVGAALLVALPLVDASDSSIEGDEGEGEGVSESASAVQGEGVDVVDAFGLESGGAVEMEEVETANANANAGWTSPARECASPASFTPPRIRTPLPPRLRARVVLPSSSSPTPTFPSSTLPLPLNASSSTPFPSPSAHQRQHHTHTSSPLAISASLPPSSSSLPPPSTNSSTGSPPHTPVRRTLSAPAALAYVAARRPAADVNWGFRAQLSEWEGVCRAGAGTL